MSTTSNPWRKRSAQEIKESVKANDYTGGYKFWPWLWYMRKMYVLGFLLNLTLGWEGGISSFDPAAENDAWIGYTVIGFFGVFAPTLIGYMLRKDYNNLKVGKSS